MHLRNNLRAQANTHLRGLLCFGFCSAMLLMRSSCYHLHLLAVCDNDLFLQLSDSASIVHIGEDLIKPPQDPSEPRTTWSKCVLAAGDDENTWRLEWRQGQVDCPLVPTVSDRRQLWATP
eukprot:2181988-Amphidinium_carterae.1